MLDFLSKDRMNKRPYTTPDGYFDFLQMRLSQIPEQLQVQEIPQDYVKSNDGSNCTFVENSENYVFTKEKKGTLLDKLFGNYSSF